VDKRPRVSAPPRDEPRTSGVAVPARYRPTEALESADGIACLPATDSVTGRAVLLKIAGPGAADFATAELRREGVALDRLADHPGVQDVVEHFEVAGHPALALAWSSRSIASELAVGPLDSTRAVGIAIRLAAVLETVHRAGIVHAAVSPPAVLLGSADEVILGGFGSATDLAAAAVVSVREIGAYTAPEVLLGEPVSAATDVYGLAATLYAMISGHAAHPAGEDEGSAAVALRILRDPVRPVIAADVPLELSDLMLWGLHTDPRLRPPSALWFADELGRVEDHAGWPRTRVTVREPARDAL
jgi:serine/threonine-protein kinase PknK